MSSIIDNNLNAYVDTEIKNALDDISNIKCIIQLDNNIIETGQINNSIGKIVISTIYTNHKTTIINNNHFYIKNGYLYANSELTIGKYDVNIKLELHDDISIHTFKIYIIPDIRLTNNSVNIDESETFIGYIENDFKDPSIEFTLTDNIENEYFEIADMDKLLLSKIPDNSISKVYPIFIKCIFTFENDKLEYIKKTFINIDFNEVIENELNIEIDDKERIIYSFTKDITDNIYFTITSGNKNLKLQLIMISSGNIYIGNNKKIEVDQYILMFPNLKYSFKYINKNISSNKLLFYITDNDEVKYSILEVFINITNVSINDVEINNRQLICKSRNTTTIESLNNDIPKYLNVNIYKLHPNIDSAIISNYINNCKIIYNTNKNKCRLKEYCSLVIEPIILNGYMSNMTAIYVKCINNDTNQSSISYESPLVLTLYLPKYRSSKNLYAYSMHPSLSGFNGKSYRLIPQYHSYQNVYFNLTLYDDFSTYVISDSEFATKCFLKGTHILTPDGYEVIESLKIGDKLITHDFRTIEILEICKVIVPSNNINNPYLIPCGTYGAVSNLYLSPLHQVLINNTFTAVKQLNNIKQVFAGFTLEYYHIKTRDYFKDTIIAEGVITETWSGIDPLDIEFSQSSQFMDMYNKVKIDEYSRMISL